MNQEDSVETPEKVRLAETEMIAEREKFAEYLALDSKHDLNVMTSGICEFLSWFGFTEEACYLKAAEFIKYKRNKDIGDLIKRFWG